MVSGGSHVEILEEHWDLTRVLQLKPRELREKLCLSKNNSYETARHMAAS
jgi:hypothetical protein